MRIWATLAMAAVLGWTALAQAAPIDMKQVPADAKWLVHIDVDAMRDSIIVQNVYKFVMKEHPEAEQGFEQFQQVFEMDLRKDLHSLTFYDTKIAKDQGVLVVKADVDEQALLAKADQAPDHAVVKHGDIDIHTWTDQKGGKRERTAVGAVAKDNVLVFGSSVDEVKAAIDALAGGSALAGSKSPLAVDVPAGATVVAGVAGLDEAKLPVKSPVAKKIKSSVTILGEHEGQSFYKSVTVVQDADTAQQIKQIVEGGRAMVALQHGHDPDVKAVLDALKVEQTDTTISAEATVPTERIWELTKKIHTCVKKVEAKVKEAKKHRGQ